MQKVNFLLTSSISAKKSLTSEVIMYIIIKYFDYYLEIIWQIFLIYSDK